MFEGGQKVVSNEVEIENESFPDENQSFQSFDSGKKFDFFNHEEVIQNFPKAPEHFQKLYEIYLKNNQTIQALNQQIIEFQRIKQESLILAYEKKNEAVDAFDELLSSEEIFQVSPYIQKHEGLVVQKQKELERLKRKYYEISTIFVEKMMMNNELIKKEVINHIYQHKKVIKYEILDQYLVAICKESHAKKQNVGDFRSVKKLDKISKEKLQNTNKLDLQIHKSSSKRSSAKGSFHNEHLEHVSEKYVIRIMPLSRYIEDYFHFLNCNDEIGVVENEDEIKKSPSQYIEELESKAQIVMKQFEKIKPFELSSTASQKMQKRHESIQVFADQSSSQSIFALYEKESNDLLIINACNEIFCYKLKERILFQTLKIDNDTIVKHAEIRFKMLYIGTSDGVLRIYEKEKSTGKYNIFKIFCCFWINNIQSSTVTHYVLHDNPKTSQISHILFVIDNRKMYQINLATYQIKELINSPSKILKISKNYIFTEEFIYHDVYLEAGKINLNCHKKMNNLYVEKSLNKNAKDIISIISKKSSKTMLKQVGKLEVNKQKEDQAEFLIIIGDQFGEITTLKV